MAIVVPSYAGAQSLGNVQAVAADTPTQSFSVPTDALSFNGRMLQKIGGDAARLAETMQSMEDERLLLEMQKEYGDFERGLLYGDMAADDAAKRTFRAGPTGPSTLGGASGTARIESDTAGTGGLLGAEQEYAFGATERASTALQEWFQSQTDRMRGLSGNGRLAAQSFAMSRQEALLDQVTRYEFQQREAYNARLRAEAQAAAVAAAEMAWASDEAIIAAEAQVASTTAAMVTPMIAANAQATAEGIASGAIPPQAQADISQAELQEEVDRQVAAAVEDTRRRAIDRALAVGGRQGIARARQLFDQGREDGIITLRGPNDPIIERLTFTESRDFTMSVATELVALHPGSLEQAIADLRSRSLPGEQEGYIIQEMERQYARQATFEAQAREQVFEDALERARAGELRSDDPVLAEFTEAQVNRLYAINDRRPLMSDADAVNALELMTDEQLAQVDLAGEYFDRLTPDDYSRQRERIDQARAAVAGDEAALAERAQVSTVSQAINQVIDVYRQSETVAGLSGPQQLELRRYMQRQQQRAVADNGEGLSYDDAILAAERWVTQQILTTAPATASGRAPTEVAEGTLADALTDIGGLYAADEQASQIAVERTVRTWAAEFAQATGRVPTYAETMAFNDALTEPIVKPDRPNLLNRDSRQAYNYLEAAGLLGAGGAPLAIALYNAGLPIDYLHMQAADALIEGGLPVTEANVAAVLAGGD